jgi:hypothetical protein
MLLLGVLIFLALLGVGVFATFFSYYVFGAIWKF